MFRGAYYYMQESTWRKKDYVGKRFQKSKWFESRLGFWGLVHSLPVIGIASALQAGNRIGIPPWFIGVGDVTVRREELAEDAGLKKQDCINSNRSLWGLIH